jgi:hypothetical protein
MQTVTEPFLGVRLIHETHTSSEAPYFRALNIYVSEIDLAAPDISFQVTPRSPMYPGPQINGAPAETTRQTTRSFADAVGAQLAINAAFYAAITQNGTLWANNVGLTSSNGDKYSPWDAFANPPESKDWFDNYFHDAMNISQTNQVTFVKMPENTGDGFQTLPSTTLYNTVTGQYRLIQNNNIKPDLPATSPDPRTAVGLTASNKLLLVTVDGRQSGFSDGLTIIELANLMKNSYGATNAIVLDGGGSTTMVMNTYSDGAAAQVLNSPSDGSERLVGSNLAAFALPNGDYNQNGSIDTADYVVWRTSIGGQYAYDAWRQRFGGAAGTANGAVAGGLVPEPARAVMLGTGVFALMGLSRRRRWA